MVTKTDETPVILPMEKAPRLTRSRIGRLQALHRKWWETGHGVNPIAYAKAKDAVFGMAMEYLPELMDCYGKSSRVQD